MQATVPVSWQVHDSITARSFAPTFVGGQMCSWSPRARRPARRPGGARTGGGLSLDGVPADVPVRAAVRARAAAVVSLFSWASVARSIARAVGLARDASMRLAECDHRARLFPAAPHSLAPDLTLTGLVPQRQVCWAVFTEPRKPRASVLRSPPARWELVDQLQRRLQSAIAGVSGLVRPLASLAGTRIYERWAGWNLFSAPIPYQIAGRLGSPSAPNVDSASR